MQSIDIYAATNPAFGALLLHAFSIAYSKKDRQSKLTYPVLFLVLPILFSRKGVSSFSKTNVQTGFFEWLERHPELKVGLVDNIRSGIPYTKSALRFAVHHSLLQTDGYEFHSIKSPPWRHPSWPVTDERGYLLSCAKRFGSWAAKVPDETTIFHALGVHP